MIEILCNGVNPEIGVDGKIIELSVKCRDICRIKEVRYYLASSKLKAERNDYDLFFATATGIPYSVKYDGESLKSFSSVYCKVEVLDEDGIITTETDCFEIWLKEEDRKAKWIENPLFDDCIGEFKKPLKIKAGVEKARLSIVGLGAFDAYFNGEKLDNCYFKPLLTDYDVRCGLNTYDYNEDNFDNGKKSITLYTYNLDDLIKEGENVLTVKVGSGFYHNVEKTFVDPSFNYGTPKLYFQLDLFEGGNHSVIISDEKCFVRNLNCKSLTFGGDFIDFSADENDFVNCTLSTTPKADFVSFIGISDKVKEEISPVNIIRGEKFVEYDFGINHSGGLRLKLRGRRGLKVVAKYYEVKTDDGEPNLNTSKWDAYNKKKEIVGNIIQSDTFILSGEEDEVSPSFSYKCYRYVRFESEEPFEIKGIKSLFICSSVKENGEFGCDNELFTKLEELFIRTQRSNMHQGVPTDCPHREKLPYTGDGAICVPAVLYGLDAVAFYDKWLKDVRDSQGNNGIIPYSAPFIGGGGGYWYCNSIANVSIALYKFTGEKRYLYENIDACFKLIEYYESQVDSEFKIKKIDFGWCLGDWANPVVSEFNIEYMSLLCFYDIVNSTVYMLDETGGDYSERKERLKTFLTEIKTSINKNYFDRDNCCYCKGIQGESLLPLIFGIVPESYEEKVKQKLFDYYSSGLNDTGFIIFPQLVEYLIENGRSDIAYNLLDRRESPSLYSMMQGETTLCELWDKHWLDYKNSDDGQITVGGGDVSHCHPMLGAVTSSLFKYVGGLDLTRLYKGIIRISPRFLGLIKRAKASKELQFGKTAVEYDNTDGFGMKIVIPPTLKGEVLLTGLPFDEITLNGSKSIEKTNGNFIFTIDSGIWEIKGETK